MIWYKTGGVWRKNESFWYKNETVWYKNGVVWHRNESVWYKTGVLWRQRAQAARVSAAGNDRNVHIRTYLPNRIMKKGRKVHFFQSLTLLLPTRPPNKDQPCKIPAGFRAYLPGLRLSRLARLAVQPTVRGNKFKGDY